jgi:thioredoxin reductase
MKKAMVSMFVLLVFVGFIGGVFAQTTKSTVVTTTKSTTVQTQKFEIVVGKVLSIDAEKNTFVLKVKKTEKEMTFSADAAIIATLKADEHVKLHVTPGTDVVVKAEVLPMKHHEGAMTAQESSKYDIVVGQVLSIDTEKNTFVVKVTVNMKTPKDKTLSADAAIIVTLKADEHVKLFLTKGTDVVVKVMPMKHRRHHNKPVVPATTK